LSALYSYAIGKCVTRVQDEEKIAEINKLTERMRDSLDILSSGFSSDRIEKISTQTLRTQGFIDLAIDLERKVQYAVSPSKKTRLPSLKAKWDIANINDARLQHQAY